VKIATAFNNTSGQAYEFEKFVCYAMSVSLCVLRFELTENDTRPAEVQQQTFTNWGRYLQSCIMDGDSDVRWLYTILITLFALRPTGFFNYLLCVHNGHNYVIGDVHPS